MHAANLIGMDVRLWYMAIVTRHAAMLVLHAYVQGLAGHDVERA